MDLYAAGYGVVPVLPRPRFFVFINCSKRFWSSISTRIACGASGPIISFWRSGSTWRLFGGGGDRYLLAEGEELLERESDL
jgi:hypothetical protein